MIIQGYDKYTDEHGKPHKTDEYGHIAIYDGTQWVSDFKQTVKHPKTVRPTDVQASIRNSFYPGDGYRLVTSHPPYMIYRKSDWK